MPSARAASPLWRPAKAPLMTRWAAEINPAHTLPEYPRPQLVRPEWLNLNGLWDYAITPDSSNDAPVAAGKILVPFAVESALSGVMTNLDERSKLWYHRSFAVPPAWRGRRVRLHFGAVDWAMEVRVNGQNIGRHQGGYDAFAFDITEALHWDGAEQISVSVTDPTEADQPRGKQSRRPEGIFYTPASGIWQTVWIEPVAATCIDDLKISPDIDSSSVHLRVEVNSLAENLRAEASVVVGGLEIARSTAAPNTDFKVSLPHPRLWSPEDPFLYDLKVSLSEKGKARDSVSSYFGMRKIGVQKDVEGVTRITLNGKLLFQVGTLDQGYWPDGIYTAPSDEALRSDIEFLKQAGFNLTRKHVKVEPDRWYYWCDKLGMLVWQDMPSGNNATAEARRNFESELLRMVEGLRNHPSIVAWVLFNEGWGQYDTAALTRWLKGLDPTRLVDNASGWTDMRAGDLIDVHSYPGPEAPVLDQHRAAVLGEFGGLGLVVEGHSWSPHHWGYAMLADEKELAARYSRAMKQVWRSHFARGLSAAVYTQTTDVETECNGLLTYDRAVAKIPPEALAAANRAGAASAPLKVILADAMFGRASWNYTTEAVPDNWFQPNFRSTGWKEGVGGFGANDTPGILVNTAWTNSDIWLRREFTIQAADLPGLKLHLFHDEDSEVYLNGVRALKVEGFITDYDEFEIPAEARAALHPGTNTIAAHCHQTSGGQGIDIGLLVARPAPGAKPPTD